MLKEKVCEVLAVMKIGVYIHLFIMCYTSGTPAVTVELLLAVLRFLNLMVFELTFVIATRSSYNQTVKRAS